MTLLVDWQIRDAVEDGLIGIDGFNPDNLGPNSYDVTLADNFITVDGSQNVVFPGYFMGVLNYVYDPHQSNENCFNTVKRAEFMLGPNEFVLGSTQEYFKINPGIVAFVHGRSSWARIGLQIHAAGLLDSGWEGNITLEIVNFSKYPIVLRAGDKIGQVTFDKVEECGVPYYKRERSKYDKQVGATESRLWKDYDES